MTNTIVKSHTFKFVMLETAPQDLLNIFDTPWYLSTYPDIAKAGVDPLTHFKNHGWKEGRWPCFIEAVQQDNELWSTKDHREAFARLQHLAVNAGEPEKSLASWFLCRWLASWGNWKEALTYVEAMMYSKELILYINHEGPYLLGFSIYFKCNLLEKAAEVLSNSNWRSSNNKTLAASMLKNDKAKIKSINEIFAKNNLAELSIVDQPTLEKLSGEAPKVSTSFYSPLVSIIIPCFNAEKTISTALRSLTDQTYTKIEIIVVDDASTDSSGNIVRSLSKLDKRIKYIRLKKNSGAYYARNEGLQSCNGSLITVHDADDWSHPQKIQLQVSAFSKNRKTKATISHWVRTDPDLCFERWRMEEGWIYRNVSSLMFKRSVFRKLGFWDNVSVNADTEYYLRILKKFGNSSVLEVYPGIPLSFGRVDRNSLTQTSATHLRTQFNGIRKDYHEAAICWHALKRRLYMPKDGIRKFIAPPHICRGSNQVRLDNLYRYLKTRNLFDDSWYLNAYPDIAEAKVEPLKHFIRFGIFEGRDATPSVSISALAQIKNISNLEAFSEWASNTGDYTFPLSQSGLQNTAKENRVLMVAHLAGDKVFGAEKSFVDCARMLSESGVGVVAILPSAQNSEYCTELLNYVEAIYYMPLIWWRRGRDEQTELTKNVMQVINFTKPDLVYINTLTLLEPSIAARNSGLKTVVHIRELPNHDPDLCIRLKADPDQIRNHIDKTADVLIANSQATADYISLGSKTTVIQNAININDFNPGAVDESDNPLKVAMLSSNGIKKGIKDFFHLAGEASRRELEIEFYLYGPETKDLKTLMSNYSEGNINFCGYAESPVNALSDKDVVLNLSHFQESFGRTIIEGMASGCVPVCYSWGALRETVDSSFGCLAEIKDWQSILTHLEKLSKDRKTLKAMKCRALTVVKEKYDSTVIARKLKQTLFHA
ncbi:glycosyltransferase [Alteromonas sp. NFXS44]|uniref:glycosyltransferase n=1 Tax=Alteromonas sp. NFXS44 TaxID=2818435 RepID=UPI0032DE59A8